MRIAHDAVRYGYEYRRAYAYIRPEYQPKVLYCLVEPEQLWVFAGVAALSGIIGNASYDLVKAVIRKIAMQARVTSAERGKELAILAERDTDRNEFLTFLREYCDGLSSIHPSMQNLLEEEEMADLFALYITSPEVDSQRIMEEIAKGNIGTEYEFSQLWKYIDGSHQ